MLVKEEIFNACSGVVLAGIVAGSALVGGNAHANEVSEVAQLNEDGKYCARVEIAYPGIGTQKRTKCRTIAEWKDKGYVVTHAETQEVL